MPIFQSRIKDNVVKGAFGIYVKTRQRTYLDAISGMFNMPFGYTCKPILDSMWNILNSMPFHPKEHFFTEDYVKTSECLLAQTGIKDGGVLFLSGGSEAVEAAISMTLQYHNTMGFSKKKKIIARTHSYHGATLGARSVTGRNNCADVFSPGYGYDTIQISPPFPVFSENGTENIANIDDIESTILQEGPENIAGFIFEPINHLKGMHQASKEYLLGVRRLCSEYKILMITDEIISGMGRTGPFLNTHKFGVKPDIVLLGKGLSGGYTPVSALVANSQIANTFKGNGGWRFFSYSHTYAANPVGIAATKAALSLLQTTAHTEEFSLLQGVFASKVKGLCDLEDVVRSESSGLTAGITFSPSLGDDSGKRVEELCYSSGVIIRGEENWITLVPSYITSHRELDDIFCVLQGAIQDAKCAKDSTYGT